MVSNKNILISGGTGLVGKALQQELLQAGYQVGVLSRSSKSGQSKIRYFQWDVENEEIDPEAISWAGAIIHLAGAGIVDKAWTKERKQEIISSRVDSAALLFKELNKQKKELSSFISASAIGYYGAYAGDEPLDEESPAGNDFVADVCQQWENILFKSDFKVSRKLAIRIGIVLSTDGGALPQIAQPIKLLVGSPLGSGRQLMSWIHIDDLTAIFRFALENEQMKGLVNAVAPEPVTNRDFTKAVAKVLKKPLILPNVPAFVMKLILGSRAGLVLGGANVQANQLKKHAFSFTFSKIESALKDLYTNK